MKELYRMNTIHENNIRKRYNFIIFYVCLYTIGFALAFWFGMGWLILMGTIPYLFLSVPRLYIPLSRLLAGDEFAEAEAQRIATEGKANSWFISKTSARIILFRLLLIGFVFWKANIPLGTIIKNIF